MKKSEKKRVKKSEMRRKHFLKLVGVVAAVLVIAFFVFALTQSPRPYALGDIDLRQGSQQIADLVKDWASPFLGALLGVGDYDEHLFSRVLLLILIFVVVYGVLSHMEMFQEYRRSSLILAVVVSLLAIRYLVSVDLINAALLPHGAMGIAISVLIPCLVYFYFVHWTISHPVGRRLAWILFGVIFIGLWWQRRVELGDANFIYWMAVAAVILNVVFDRQIHTYFGFSESRRALHALTEHEKNEWHRQMNRFRKDVEEGTYDGRERAKNREHRRLMKWLKDIERRS